MNKNTMACGCCQTSKATQQFYKSPFDSKVFLPMCKLCAKEKFKSYKQATGKDSSAMWLILSELGIPFLSEIWSMVEASQVLVKPNADVVMAYLRTLSESGKVVTGFWDSDVMLDQLMKTSVDRESDKEEMDLSEQQKIWGKFLDSESNLDIEAYELLNSAFDDYTKEVFDMDTNLERRYRDLAKCDLRLRRANESGDGGEISKAQEALNKQLALLKMNDFRSTQVDERKKHIDRIAWMIEETEPAEEEDENAYRDIRGYEKIYNSWMRSMRNILAGQRDYPDIPKEEM